VPLKRCSVSALDDWSGADGPVGSEYNYRASLVAYACCGGECIGFGCSRIWRRVTTDLGGVRCDRLGLQLLSDLLSHTVGTAVLRRACAFWSTSKLVTYTKSAIAVPLCGWCHATDQDQSCVQCRSAAWRVPSVCRCALRLTGLWQCTPALRPVRRSILGYPSLLRSDSRRLEWQFSDPLLREQKISSLRDQRVTGIGSRVGHLSSGARDWATVSFSGTSATSRGATTVANFNLEADLPWRPRHRSPPPAASRRSYRQNYVNRGASPSSCTSKRHKVRHSARWNRTHHSGQG